MRGGAEGPRFVEKRFSTAPTHPSKWFDGDEWDQRGCTGWKKPAPSVCRRHESSTRSTEKQRTREPRSRMRQLRTSGSGGAGAGDRPGLPDWARATLRSWRAGAAKP